MFLKSYFTAVGYALDFPKGVSPLGRVLIMVGSGLGRTIRIDDQEMSADHLQT